MALALTLVGRRYGGKQLYRYVETGTANTLLTATLAADTVNTYRVVFVTCKYSAAPTQAGVTVAIDSGGGAAYDTTLLTGTANAQNTTFIPQTELLLGTDDGLVVSAPGGGVGLTAAIAIYLERG